MKKIKVITLFFITVLAGILILNELMVGLPGTACYCVNGTLAQQECEGACGLYGGCESYRAACIGYCYWPETCVTHMYNICKDETPTGLPIVRDGFHYYYSCYSCDGI